MNQDSDIHRLAPSLFVDAFGSHKESLSNPNAHWILTHFHADHYRGLKKGEDYVCVINANMCVL